MAQHICLFVGWDLFRVCCLQLQRLDFGSNGRWKAVSRVFDAAACSIFRVMGMKGRCEAPCGVFLRLPCKACFVAIPRSARVIRGVVCKYSLKLHR